MSDSDRKIILVDMDGVIVDFEYWFLKRLMAEKPDLEFIPIRERRKFYAQDDYLSDYTSLIHAIFKSKGFFLDMPPIERAIETMRTLVGKHDVFICTSPYISSEHCVGEKFEWVRKHLGDSWLSRTVVSADKTIIGGNYLIDDKPVIAGMRKPDWEHIIFDAPYNREIKDKRRLANWQNLYDIIPELR